MTSWQPRRHYILPSISSNPDVRCHSIYRHPQWSLAKREEREASRREERKRKRRKKKKGKEKRKKEGRKERRQSSHMDHPNAMYTFFSQAGEGCINIQTAFLGFTPSLALGSLSGNVTSYTPRWRWPEQLTQRRGLEESTLNWEPTALSSSLTSAINQQREEVGRPPGLVNSNFLTRRLKSTA